jgi:hypothetical protein
MAQETEPQRWYRWLLIGWLVAGALDITYACGYSYLWNGTAPSRVLQYVASGALGPSSFQGGTLTALAGLGFHFLNAFLFAWFFFVVATKLPRLIEKPFLTGAIYGIGVYVVMNYVVVPLSRIGPRPTPPTLTWVTGLLVHMFLIGVPIAVAAKEALSPRKP